MGKVALITGITGQDGSYLADLLLEKGYAVHGIIRRSSSFNTDRVSHLREREHWRGDFSLHYGDLTDASSVSQLVQQIQPDEVYHLGAQSHVRVSFDVPVYTANATAIGTLHMLEAVRRHSPKSRFYQASSSEMYGLVQETPQKETTPFYPRSPYGIAKVYAYWIVKNYREAYGMFTCNGILFNHESPRRGSTFVTRKITHSLALIKAGKQDALYLGNLDARRDWGYAPEYVEAMWRMLQEDKPDDYVIATGETHTVREFCEEAFRHAGLPIRWQGEGLEEKGVDAKTGRVLIAIDPRYFRPTEVDLLVGDASKAERELGWKPTVTFHELVRLMVDADIKALSEGTDYKFR